jgi:geranylgeranyl pyrophosphate synthase
MKRVSEIGLEFMGRGGKRLRPRICEAAYRFLAPGGSADIRPLMDAVECFHKASLIHDDIQDASEARYGLPATWVEHGVPLAIAAGDWLLAHGIAMIEGSGFPNVAEMSKLTSRAILDLCEGQGDELSGHGDYVSVCERKTGSLFALAAGLGALAAGADPEPYWEWGVVYGVLFQVMDDIRDDGATPRLEALRDEYGAKLAAARPSENWPIRAPDFMV